MFSIQPRFANLAMFLVFLAFCYLAVLIWSVDEPFPAVDVELSQLLGFVILAVEVGSQAVLDVGNKGEFGVSRKSKTAQGKDELLTQADLLSNQLMLAVLKRFPGLNIVSEEKTEALGFFDSEQYLSKQPEIYARIRPLIDLFPKKKYNLQQIVVWIDPLDATQEFTEGLNQYVSVMACITFNDVPIFGVIYRPFTGEKAYGMNKVGVLNEKGEERSKASWKNESKILLISRSHAGTVKEMLADASDKYLIEAAGGSGYKSLRLLNETAELYLHKTEIKKWDTCAGDALLRAAGGAMLNFDGELLKYRKNDDPVFRRGLLAAAEYPFTHFQQLRKHLQNI